MGGFFSIESWTLTCGDWTGLLKGPDCLSGLTTGRQGLEGTWWYQGSQA